MSASVHWPKIVEFYESLISEHGWDVQPLLGLAKWIGGSPWGQVIFPSTSHEALGLSLVETYEDRLKTPMVYITCRPPQREFEVVFQEHQGLTTRTVRSKDVLSAATWDEIVAWLGARLS